MLQIHPGLAHSSRRSQKLIFPLLQPSSSLAAAIFCSLFPTTVFMWITQGGPDYGELGKGRERRGEFQSCCVSSVSHLIHFSGDLEISIHRPFTTTQLRILTSASQTRKPRLWSLLSPGSLNMLQLYLTHSFSSCSIYCRRLTPWTGRVWGLHFLCCSLLLLCYL